MFWRDDPFVLPGEVDPNSPQGMFQKFYQNQPLGSDDRQLFDREKRWPIDDQHCDILGEEHVLIDGPTRPGMINAIFMVNRQPGLDHKDFFEHWLSDHAELASKLPGLRRYIQNHLVARLRQARRHDARRLVRVLVRRLDAYKAAGKSPEWAAMEADGATLFAERKQCVIGQEYVQKDESWKPRDYGALTMTEDEIRAKLQEQGYGHALEAEPDIPARLKASAAKGKIAVWTPYHLASYDEPWIDARPKRNRVRRAGRPGRPVAVPATSGRTKCRDEALAPSDYHKGTEDMAVKRITAANENKVNGRSRRQAQAYWAESHGKLVANNPNLKTLPPLLQRARGLRRRHQADVHGHLDVLARRPVSLVAAFPAPDWSPVGPDDRHVFDRSSAGRPTTSTPTSSAKRTSSSTAKRARA